MKLVTIALIALFATVPAVAQPLPQGRLPSVGPLPAGGTHARVSTVTTAVGSGDVALRFAASYPPTQRAEVERMFQKLLATYPQVETKLGIPHGDVAGSAAFLILAAYEIYRDTSLDRAALPAAVAQIREALATSSEFANATPASRRDLYEQHAMIGLFLVGFRARLVDHPDATASRNLRAAAKQYLVEVLHADPDAVTIDTTGVHGAAIGPSEAPAKVAPAGGTERSPAADAANHIVTVGFVLEQTIGYGGYVQLTPTPMVFFDNGDALREMKNLGDPHGLEANKQAHPKDWTKWRKSGNEIERLEGSRWKKLAYAKQYGRLPSHYKLEGSYSALGGGGNLAVGGDFAVMTWSTLAFTRDGRFTTGKGVGAHSPKLATRSVAEPASGTYEISGYLLELRFDDGRRAVRAIVMDPKETKAIWIDGIGYTR